MAEKRGTASILLKFLIPKRGDKGRLPKTTHRQKALKTGRCQVFYYTGSGFYLLAGSSAENGQRED